MASSTKSDHRAWAILPQPSCLGQQPLKMQRQGIPLEKGSYRDKEMSEGIAGSNAQKHLFGEKPGGGCASFNKRQLETQRGLEDLKKIERQVTLASLRCCNFAI